MPAVTCVYGADAIYIGTQQKSINIASQETQDGETGSYVTRVCLSYSGISYLKYVRAN